MFAITRDVNLCILEVFSFEFGVRLVRGNERKLRHLNDSVIILWMFLRFF